MTVFVPTSLRSDSVGIRLSGPPALDSRSQTADGHIDKQGEKIMRRAGLVLALALAAVVGAVQPAGASAPAGGSGPAGASVPVPGGAAGTMAVTGGGPAKGPPPIAASRSPRVAASGGTQFFYGSAYQYGTSDGAWGFFTVTKPTLASSMSRSAWNLGGGPTPESYLVVGLG
jgi:hypothetical protein